MSTHISAKKDDISEKVIMPGDPLRAKYIAENYLTDSVRVNEIRNAWGYTGLYKGERVSVITSGMGAPSMLIYATELCTYYGCKKIIRVGTAGGMKEEMKLGDIILSQAISTTSAINEYALPGHFAPIADFELLSRADRLAKEAGLRYYVGGTLTNDHFYVENKLEYSKQWEKYGVLAAEQEGVALYTVAALYGVQALMILSVVANLYRPEETLSAKEKESGLDSMIKLALETLCFKE